MASCSWRKPPPIGGFSTSIAIRWKELSNVSVSPENENLERELILLRRKEKMRGQLRPDQDLTSTQINKPPICRNVMAGNGA
jgi:hypothetical protein